MSVANGKLPPPRPPQKVTLNSFFIPSLHLEAPWVRPGGPALAPPMALHSFKRLCVVQINAHLPFPYESPLSSSGRSSSPYVSTRSL